MAVNGTYVYIKKGNDIIAGTRANELQVDCDIIPIASADTADWEDKIAGRKKWAMSVGFLVPAVSNIGEVLEVGQTFTLRFGGTGNGVSGSAILKSCKITANTGNLVQGSFSFEGKGALTPTT